jgi:hypothetical protein
MFCCNFCCVVKWSLWLLYYIYAFLHTSTRCGHTCSISLTCSSEGGFGGPLYSQFSLRKQSSDWSAESGSQPQVSYLKTRTKLLCMKYHIGYHDIPVLFGNFGCCHLYWYFSSLKLRNWQSTNKGFVPFVAYFLLNIVMSMTTAYFYLNFS